MLSQYSFRICSQVHAVLIYLQMWRLLYSEWTVQHNFTFCHLLQKLYKNLQIPEQVSTKMQNTQTSLDLLIKQNKPPNHHNFCLLPSFLLRVFLSKQLLHCTCVCPHFLYPSRSKQPLDTAGNQRLHGSGSTSTWTTTIQKKNPVDQVVHEII